MGLPTVRRRVGKLEAVFAPDRFAGYPPFSPEEIDGLLARLGDRDQRWSFEEEARLARQCLIAQGEFLVWARGNGVSIKRYPGLNMADL
jgi:hypothetical protein